MVRHRHKKGLREVQFGIHDLFGLHLPWFQVTPHEDSTSVSKIVYLADKDFQFTPGVSVSMVAEFMFHF